MPDKPGKRRGRKVKGWRVVLAIGYVAILAWSAFNVAFPASAIPGISFNYAPQSYYWTLTIPPNPEGYFPQFNETAVLNVTVSATQPFADGVPITINVLGCEKERPNGTADQFVIGFTGAYDDKHPGSTYNGELVIAFDFLQPKPPATWPNNCPSFLGPNAVHFVGETTDATFYFKNPGTYPVSVKANYWPNLFGAPIQYNYPDNVIDVQSSASVNQGVYNKAGTIVLIASSAFVILELVPEIRKRLQ